MANWADLPVELLKLISEWLPFLDLLCYRAVCSSWRHAANGKRPLLMVSHQWNSNSQGFFSLSGNKICYLDLPEIRGKRCCGSYEDWLAMVDNDPAIVLFNPFTKSQIYLPPLTSFPDVIAYQSSNIYKEYTIREENGMAFVWPASRTRNDFISKIVLSSSPDAGADCIVIASHGLFVKSKLAFCRPGDDAWTVLDKLSGFRDIIHHNGKLCGIDYCGKLVECDVTTRVIRSVLHENSWACKYLVEFGGELLLVIRRDERASKRARFFYVYKINFTGEMYSKVKSLGKKALFLSDIQSISFSSTDFPRCKPNSIYFTDDFIGYSDLCVFNMEDGTIEKVAGYRPSCPRLSCPRPIWFTPSLC